MMRAVQRHDPVNESSTMSAHRYPDPFLTVRVTRVLPYCADR